MRNTKNYFKTCNTLTAVVNSFTRIFSKVLINEMNVFLESDGYDELIKVSFSLDTGVTVSQYEEIYEGYSFTVGVEGEFSEINKLIYDSINEYINSSLIHADIRQIEMLRASLQRILK